MDKKTLKQLERQSRENFQYQLFLRYKKVEEPYSNTTSIVMAEYKGVRYLYSQPDPCYNHFDYTRTPLRAINYGYFRLNDIGIPTEFICTRDFDAMLYNDLSKSTGNIELRVMLYKDLLGHHTIVLTKELLEKCRTQAQKEVAGMALEVVL